jgi:hypothetical protein
MHRPRQLYSDLSEIHVGQRVTYNNQGGTIVFVIDHDEYSQNFPAEDWSYLKTGFMIRFDNGALLHIELPDEHFLRDKN